MVQTKYYKLAMFYYERNEYNELFKLLIMGCEHGCDDCVDFLMELYDIRADRHQVFNTGQIEFYQNIWLNDRIDPNKQYRINYLGLLYTNGFGVQRDLYKGFEYYHYAAMLGNIYAVTNILDTGHACFDVYGRLFKNSNLDCVVRAQLCHTLMHLLLKHKYYFQLSQKVFGLWRNRITTTVRVETTIKLLEYWRCNDLATFRIALATVWEHVKIRNMYKIYVYLLNISDDASVIYARAFIAKYIRAQQEEVKYIIRCEKYKLDSADPECCDGELLDDYFELKIDEN
jgi:hypothetical protein